VSKPLVRCDHADDRKCPWPQCPHHEPHAYGSDPDSPNCADECGDGNGEIVFEQTQCVPCPPKKET
jgi:hypothetical protein